MPTSNAVQPGQSLYATLSGVFAGAGVGADIAALALMAGAAGAAEVESGLSLLQPNNAKTNANGTRNLAIADVWPGASFGRVSSGLRFGNSARLQPCRRCPTLSATSSYPEKAFCRLRKPRHPPCCEMSVASAAATVSQRNPCAKVPPPSSIVPMHTGRAIALTKPPNDRVYRDQISTSMGTPPSRTRTSSGLGGTVPRSA